MTLTDTHDYVIEASGKTYKGEILLDLNQTYVNHQGQADQGILAAEQTAVNTFMTAASTLFTSLRGLDSVYITLRNTSNKSKKTP